jgi:hypothetical protein
MAAAALVVLFSNGIKPQNTEQGISNFEVLKKAYFLLLHFLFDIRYSKKRLYF